MGVLISTDAAGKVTHESHTFTCGHCNTVYNFEAKTSASGLKGPPPDIGGFCRSCMKNVCGPCCDQGTCTPFLKRVEAAERRYSMLKAILGAVFLSVLLPFAAHAQGVPTPVGPPVLTVAVQGNATVTGSGSATFVNISANTQLALFVNIKASPTGTTPTLTYTISEVDPGDNSTVFTGAQTASTAALNAIGDPTPISISATHSTAVKVSWVTTGTSPSFTQVYSTLTAFGGALNTISGCGTAGAPSCGFVSVQGDPAGTALPVQTTGNTVLAANAANRTTTAATLSTFCTSATNSCAGTSVLIIDVTGAQSAEFNITAISSPVGITPTCDKSGDNGATYLKAGCTITSSTSGVFKSTALANGDIAANTWWRISWDGAVTRVRIRNDALTGGNYTAAGAAVFAPATPAQVAHNVALGMPADANGNALLTPVGGADQSNPTTPRQLTFASPSTSALATAPAAVVSISPNPSTVCTSTKAISQTTSTDLVTSTNKLHICSVVLVSTTAQSFSLTEGTGTTCASGAAAVIGSTTVANGIPAAANSGMVAVSDRAWLRTATTADHLCLLQSSTGLIAGVITYADQP